MASMNPATAMGRGLRRHAAWMSLALALAALAVGAQRGWLAWREHQANQQLAQGQAGPGAPARVVFAQAVALERAGRIEEALAVYAEAEALGSDAVQHAARVNVANLYLRRGIQAAREDGNAARALTLVQLAKTGLRRALRERPDDWNARYNLELALRLLPDYTARNWSRSGKDSEVEDAVLRDKAAWTDMIGTPRGMH